MMSIPEALSLSSTGQPDCCFITLIYHSPAQSNPCEVPIMTERKSDLCFLFYEDAFCFCVCDYESNMRSASAFDAPEIMYLDALNINVTIKTTACLLFPGYSGLTFYVFLL